MRRQPAVVLYLLVMIAILVGVDVSFLRHDLWLRLIVNVAIVAVFVAGYFRFLKPPSAAGQ